LPDKQTRSDLLEIAKPNADFRRIYGPIIGAFLHLRSMDAVGGRSFFWNGLVFSSADPGLVWLQRHG
jgi:hypothetical protein